MGRFSPYTLLPAHYPPSRNRLRLQRVAKGSHPCRQPYVWQWTSAAIMYLYRSERELSIYRHTMIWDPYDDTRGGIGYPSAVLG